MRQALLTKAQTQRSAREQLNAARVARITAKGWPADVTLTVLAGNLAVGMTSDQVRTAWGDPEEVNATTTVSGTREQRVYGIGNYVYFDGGRAATIQHRCRLRLVVRQRQQHLTRRDPSPASAFG